MCIDNRQAQYGNGPRKMDNEMTVKLSKKPLLPLAFSESTLF